VTSRKYGSTVLTVVGIILLVVSATILGSHYFGAGAFERYASARPASVAFGESDRVADGDGNGCANGQAGGSGAGDRA